MCSSDLGKKDTEALLSGLDEIEKGEKETHEKTEELKTLLFLMHNKLSPILLGVLNLFLIGTTLLFVGYLLSYACPLNKRLWSPSFVLLTCGIAALSLALLLYIIDVKQNKKWFSFFEASMPAPSTIGRITIKKLLNCCAVPSKWWQIGRASCRERV